MVHDKSLLAPVDATPQSSRSCRTRRASWTGGATYEFTLLVSRRARTATYSILLFISADRYMPRATVTDFDENLKYNPTADTYAAVYFEATSPDPDRYCCDSVWEVEGETIDLLAKDAAAASPMLINLGLTRANAVYRLKLTVTDGIGSTSSSVVSLTTNGPPTSGTMAVALPRHGSTNGVRVSAGRRSTTPTTPADLHGLPPAPELGVFEGGCSGAVPVAGDAPGPALTPRWRTSTRARGSTTLPKPDRVNITCVGRVFGRYLSFAEARAGRVDALEMGGGFVGLRRRSAVGDGGRERRRAPYLASNVASVIGGDENGRSGTMMREDAEQLAAEQALIDNLFAATIAAASQVGTGTAAAATSRSSAVG